jgi:hypothetical protein
VPRHPDTSSTSDAPTEKRPSVEVSSAESDTEATTAEDALKKDSGSSSSKLKPHVEFRSVREVSGTGSLFKLEVAALACYRHKYSCSTHIDVYNQLMYMRFISSVICKVVVQYSKRVYYAHRHNYSNFRSITAIEWFQSLSYPNGCL